MKYDRLYKLILEDEDQTYEVTDKKFAKKLGIKGEKLNAKELYSVALDIRKHPSDYADMGETFFVKLFERNPSLVNTYSFDMPNLYDTERKIYFMPNYGQNNSYRFIQIKIDDKFYRTVIKGLKAQTVKRYTLVNGNNNEASVYSRRYLSILRKTRDDEYRAINLLTQEKLEDILLRSAVDHSKRTTKREWSSKFYGDVLDMVNKITFAHGENALEDNKTMTNLFGYFKVTSPDINMYLTKTLYGYTIHPSDMDKRLLGLSDDLLTKIYRQGKTPVELAIQSCAMRNTSLWNTTGFRGEHGVLNVGPNEITRKEAYEWLIGCAQNIRERAQERRKKLEKVAKEKGMSYEEILDYLAIKDDKPINKYIINFPTYIIRQRAKEIGVSQLYSEEVYSEEVYSHGANISLSFNNMSVFRWFVKNMKSTYFWKEQVAHGPARQHRTFKPIELIVNIHAEDLVNGLKTSPEIAFQHSAEREAKKYEVSDAVRFDRYNDFKDSKFVKVLRTQGDLKREGEALQHCVGGYGDSCLSGRSLIVSLPKSTAELNPTDLSVYQHYGKGNSKPPQEDVEHLKEWIKFNSDVKYTHNYNPNLDDEDFDY
jgi:hypothetical protein